MKQIAFISGASKGIGAAIALGLAKDGFDIWLNYKSDHTAAQKIADTITSLGQTCTLIPFDVSKAAEVEAALTPLLQKHTPYALVNNAGITHDSLLGLMSPEAWENVLAVHLNGFFHLTRMIVPHMQRNRRGRIVTISSVSGLTGVAGQVNYSCAKAGLLGATKALAKEVAKRNILVNAVAPGLIATDMTAHMETNDYLLNIPMRRLGTAEEVANVVRFLCSDLSSYMTGQVLSVNGGLYM